VEVRKPTEAKNKRQLASRASEREFDWKFQWKFHWKFQWKFHWKFHWKFEVSLEVSLEGSLESSRGRFAGSFTGSFTERFTGRSFTGKLVDLRIPVLEFDYVRITLTAYSTAYRYSPAAHFITPRQRLVSADLRTAKERFPAVTRIAPE
jgi:hypothetical protein